MKTTQLLLATLPLAGVALYGTTADASVDRPTCQANSTVTACEHALRTRVAQAGRGSPRPEAAPLQLLDVRDKFAALDLGARGDSPGDTLFFNNRLRDAANTTTVGRFVSRCTRMPGPTYHCQGTLTFSHSTIELATTTSLEGPITAAITGGTGAYEGGTGQVRISDSGRPGVSQLAVHLVRSR